MSVVHVAFCSVLADLYLLQQLEPTAPCLAAMPPQELSGSISPSLKYTMSFKEVIVEIVSFTAFIFSCSAVPCCSCEH